MKVSNYFLSSSVLLGNMKARKAREANLDPLLKESWGTAVNMYGTQCNEELRLATRDSRLATRVEGKFRAVRGCLLMKRSKKR